MHMAAYVKQVSSNGNDHLSDSQRYHVT